MSTPDPDLSKYLPDDPDAEPNFEVYIRVAREEPEFESESDQREDVIRIAERLGFDVTEQGGVAMRDNDQPA